MMTSAVLGLVPGTSWYTMTIASCSSQAREAKKSTVKPNCELECWNGKEERKNSPWVEGAGWVLSPEGSSQPPWLEQSHAQALWVVESWAGGSMRVGSCRQMCCNHMLDVDRSGAGPGRGAGRDPAAWQGWIRAAAHRAQVVPRHDAPVHHQQLAALR